jgi:hypothetical protein
MDIINFINNSDIPKKSQHNLVPRFSQYSKIDQSEKVFTKILHAEICYHKDNINYEANSGS